MPLPLSDYASLIEPTWLPPRLFDLSRQGPLDCSSPCQGGGGEGAAFFKIVVAQSCFKQPLFAPARVSRAAPDLASRHR